MQNVVAISELLTPCDARFMRCHPVSISLNHVASDDEECSRPAQTAEAQDRLFGCTSDTRNFRVCIKFSGMDAFPEFMKNPANRIARSHQATPGVEGYVFNGADESQMAFWTCTQTATSAEHVHKFDEYMLVVQAAIHC